MEKLPEDLKIEILVRLPVKFLTRLKRVQVRFCLICSPNFSELHYQRTSSQQYSHRFLYKIASEIRSIDINYTSFHDDSASVKLHFLLHQPHTDFRILGSCRGLVLRLLETEQKLFSWNPSTGFCKRIPPHPRLSWKFVVPCGFCYDESTDDYVLLLAHYGSFGLFTSFEVLSQNQFICKTASQLPSSSY
ncbi:F-box/kelch-repeat protein At3g23880-like [Neltuma alba]|uniref:F-box/kelch-repeat protein At3g23880-like n=1 Tax=Neltuma alba TaxID=207710 RepID=UPI0010A5014A|nr:F-box/kelch-repeat protein At3g23880-like [Prosopis alba]